MNKLQKDFKKSIKRKAHQKIKRLDITLKTGRMKVLKRLQKSYQNKLIEYKLKQVDTPNTASHEITLSPTA